MNDPLPALRALAGGARSASDIKAAEASLLAAEDADPDRCARSLLTVALCPTAAAPAERLAALLALRAIAGRRWSDRGRGPLPTSRPGGRPARRLLADDAKGLVRRAVLSAVVGEDVGPAEGGATAAAATTAFPFAQAARGLDGEREDGGDGAGPLGRAASALLAALGRRDPPARFAALAPALVRAAASEGGRRDAALRSLFALDEVVESLCEKRLLADRRHVGQIAVASLPSLVGAVYLPAVEAALGGGGGEADGGGGNADAAGTVHASRTAALALSVLRRLLARSLPEALRDPAAAATADRLLEAALRSLPPLVAAAMGGGALPPPLPLRDLLGATCALPVEVQKSHPVEFAARGYLGPYCAWFGDVLQSLPREGLVRDAMTFLANVFANKMYDASDPEADRAAAAIASSAFPPARRVELALAAVRSHLPLSPRGSDAGGTTRRGTSTPRPRGRATRTAPPPPWRCTCPARRAGRRRCRASRRRSATFPARGTPSRGKRGATGRRKEPRPCSGGMRCTPPRARPSGRWRRGPTFDLAPTSRNSFFRDLRR